MSNRECPSCGRSLPEAAPQSITCPFCEASSLPVDQVPRRMWVRHGIDLRLLAKRQRRMLWMVLAFMIGQVLPLAADHVGSAFRLPGVSMAFLSTYALLMILIMICSLQVLHATGANAMMLAVCGFGLLMPMAGVFILLGVNRFATTALREAGLRVSLMGVKDEEVVRILCSYLCRKCGYNLTGNVSGRCPECGTPVPQPPLAQPVR